MSHSRGRFDLIFIPLFVAVEILFGYLLQVSPYPENNYYRFIAIAIAFVFALFHLRLSAESVFMVFGLLFTLIADWYLVMKEPVLQLEGMICFCFTQAFYGALLFLGHRSRNGFITHFTVRTFITLACVTVTVAVLGDGTDALSIVSVFYYANLILNLIISLMQLRRSVLLPVALLLFLCCDTVIGLHVMNGAYIQIDFVSDILSTVQSAGFDVAWAFYLPSQILLALVIVEMKARRGKISKTVLKKSGGYYGKICLARKGA